MIKNKSIAMLSVMSIGLSGCAYYNIEPGRTRHVHMEYHDCYPQPRTPDYILMPNEPPARSHWKEPDPGNRPTPPQKMPTWNDINHRSR